MRRERFGRSLKSLRESTGESQAGAAAAIGTDCSFYAGVEAGRNNVSLDKTVYDRRPRWRFGRAAAGLDLKPARDFKTARSLFISGTAPGRWRADFIATADRLARRPQRRDSLTPPAQSNDDRCSRVVSNV